MAILNINPIALYGEGSDFHRAFGYYVKYMDALERVYVMSTGAKLSERDLVLATMPSRGVDYIIEAERIRTVKARAAQEMADSVREEVVAQLGVAHAQELAPVCVLVGTAKASCVDYFTPKSTVCGLPVVVAFFLEVGDVKVVFTPLTIMTAKRKVVVRRSTI